jgi:hypothetical protein
MKTILLDRSGWDLVVDAFGNIAVASEPYALAQDAASAVKLFRGELWYNTVPGVPYWASILGKSPPPLPLMKQTFAAAALTVPGVTAARCFFSAMSGRAISGQVQITDAAGRAAIAEFG